MSPSRENKPFWIFYIGRDLSADGDLRRVRDYVRGSLREGHDTALSFPGNVSLSSRVVGLILVCIDIAREYSREFAIVKHGVIADEQFRTVLQKMNIRVVADERELAGSPRLMHEPAFS